MICPTCGQSSERVIETRQAGGITVRTRACIDGHRWRTGEVAMTVLRAIGMDQVRRRMTAVDRGVKLRQAAQARRELIAYMLEQGASASAIAAEAGCTEARVRQIRAELAESGDGEEHRNHHRSEPGLAGRRSTS